MSTYDEFMGGRSTEPGMEFEERRRYLEYVRDSGFKLLDTLYDQKHYGFLNHNYEIVYPNPSSAVNFSSPATQVQTLNYVSTQFDSFREEYFSAAQNFDYVTVPSSISDLTPVKGYVNMLEDYKTYQEMTIEKILFFLRRADPIPVSDYEKFIEEVNKIIVTEQDSLAGYRVTRSGFLLSKDSLPYYTGLYVDIATGLSPDLDLEKGKMIQDPGFKCYVEYANRHGFYVDANAPWRMVLDLSSKVTQDNIVNEKDRNFNDFYSNIYRSKAGYDDFYDLKSFYERAFLFYNLRRGETFDPSSVFTGVNMNLLVESFVLIRFLEIGAISKTLVAEENSLQNKFLQETQRQAKSRFNAIYKIKGREEDETAISGHHGLSGYVNKVCADFLKSKLIRYKSNFNLPQINIQTRAAQSFTPSTAERRQTRISRTTERSRRQGY